MKGKHRLCALSEVIGIRWSTYAVPSLTLDAWNPVTGKRVTNDHRPKGGYAISSHRL